MTKLRGLAPILETKDLKETVEYYKTVLGFGCEGFYPEGDNPWWAEMKRDEVAIMLTSRRSDSDYAKPALTGSIYLYPNNVDEIWEELKDKADVSYEIETFDYGMREFAIRDCNGYLLQFGQGVDTLTNDQ